MSVKSSLRHLVIALGGTPTEKTVRGLLGEVSVALGGDGNGGSVSKQIENIAIARGYVPEPAGDAAIVGTAVVGESTVGGE